ncbi:MAG: DUF6266 family protein [Chitinophagaceae bacterium]
MGLMQNGILDSFTGKVGTVVGTTWKGKPVLRAIQKRKKNRKSTQAQQEQRAKFAMGSVYLQQLTPLLNITFGNYAKEQTAGNTAFSHMLRNAITGVYPDYTLDWPVLLVSKGKLPLPKNPVAAAEAGKITFNWLAEINADATGIKPTDRSVLVVICPKLQQCMYTTLGASRSVGTAAIDVANFAGNEVHTYFAFVSEDGKKVSNSVYTGMQTMP